MHAIAALDRLGPGAPFEPEDGVGERRPEGAGELGPGAQREARAEEEGIAERRGHLHVVAQAVAGGDRVAARIGTTAREEDVLEGHRARDRVARRVAPQDEGELVVGRLGDLHARFDPELRELDEAPAQDRVVLGEPEPPGLAGQALLAQPAALHLGAVWRVAGGEALLLDEAVDERLVDHDALGAGRLLDRRRVAERAVQAEGRRGDHGEVEQGLLQQLARGGHDRGR